MIFENLLIKSEFLKILKNGCKLNLIHRGSRDSLKEKKFHEKIEGKGPYVFLIKSDNHIFGGYTEI